MTHFVEMNIIIVCGENNMKNYKESYRSLCHGTTKNFAIEIRNNGFEPSVENGNWCGEGVYFYDIKAKAWWAAERKVQEISKIIGKRQKAEVVYADIIDIPKEKIFDLRVHNDLCNFEKEVKDFLDDNPFGLESEELDVAEETIIKRAMLIGYYAKKNNFSLVIGNFLQRPRQENQHAIEFSQSLDMVFGIETIYCVKDLNIISNIE